MRAISAALLLCAASVLSAATVPPAEIDARADAISETLRCVVCLNQSIADSDAALAEAMRELVRDRVAAGDTDEQVRAHMVARYGEAVLLRPQSSARNLWLWAGPFAVLLVGTVGAVLFVRSRGEGGGQGASQAAPLTQAERAELARLRG